MLSISKRLRRARQLVEKLGDEFLSVPEDFKITIPRDREDLSSDYYILSPKLLRRDELALHVNNVFSKDQVTRYIKAVNSPFPDTPEGYAEFVERMKQPLRGETVKLKVTEDLVTRLFVPAALKSKIGSKADAPKPQVFMRIPFTDFCQKRF